MTFGCTFRQCLYCIHYTDCFMTVFLLYHDISVSRNLTTLLPLGGGTLPGLAYGGGGGGVVNIIPPNSSSLGPDEGLWQCFLTLLWPSSAH